jgi:hypothetical protein
VVVFVLGGLREIMMRYGDLAANHLIAELVRNRINVHGTIRSFLSIVYSLAPR